MLNSVVKPLKTPYRNIGGLISLAIFVLALVAIFRTLQEFHVEDILIHFREHSLSVVTLAIFFTAASYTVVTGYDFIALNHVKQAVSYSHTSLTAFLASVFGNNLGFALLTGTSVRYRMYSQVGVSSLVIAGISSMCALTTILGMGMILSVGLMFQSGELTKTAISALSIIKMLTGVGILGLIILYVGAALYRPGFIRIGKWLVPIPKIQIVLAQLALGTINLMLVGGLIYTLISPYNHDVGFFTFLSVFAFALIAGSASNVPGGLGVFESVLLLGLREFPPDALLGCILLFRCIYYLIPLAIASALLAYYELTQKREPITIIWQKLLTWLNSAAPLVISIVIIFAGTLILFSYPISGANILLKSKFLAPLALLEIANLAGYLTGIGLLIMARGIALQLKPAYEGSFKLLVVGIFASLLHDFDFLVAITLASIAFVLWSKRADFCVVDSLLGMRLPTDWIILLTVIVGATLGIGLFAFKTVPFPIGHLWTFSYEAQFSRFLRGMACVLVVYSVVVFVASRQNSNRLNRDFIQN